MVDEDNDGKNTKNFVSELSRQEAPADSDDDEDDEEEGWMGSMGTDFRTIAACFSDTLPTVIGGVGNLVKKTALSVAAEIAQLERSMEAPEVPERKLLPWLVDTGKGWKIDEEIRQEILLLSSDEATFRAPYTEAGEDFALDEATLDLINQLVEEDDKLAIMSMELSNGKYLM